MGNDEGVSVSPTNSLSISIPNVASQNAVESPVVAITVQNAQLVFSQQLGFSNVNFDGGFLDIKIGGGPFVDILLAGGSFAANVTMALSEGSRRGQM